MQSFIALSVSEQIDVLLDTGSRRDLVSSAPEELSLSSGLIEGASVLLAAQHGQVQGGTLGAAQTRALQDFLRTVRYRRPRALILLLDSGGVRLHEGNRGMVGLSRVLELIVAVRDAGVVAIALIGGKVGCWGGATLLAGVCDTVLMVDKARYGLSGPKVLQEMARINGVRFEGQTAMPFTSAEHRHTTGEIDRVVEDNVATVHVALSTAITNGVREPVQRAVQSLAEADRRLHDRQVRMQTIEAALPGVASAAPVEEMLDALFDSYNKAAPVAGMVSGTGVIDRRHIPFFGCTADIAMGPAQGRELLRSALAAYRSRPSCILLLADAVQAFDIQNEETGYGQLLGALAQLLVQTAATCCPVIGLVRHAGSGASMVALAMCGVTLYAVENAQIHPLPPNVVAAFVGDKPRSQIDAGPDPENFKQLGAVREVWGSDYIAQLRRILLDPDIARAQQVV